MRTLWSHKAQYKSPNWDFGDDEYAEIYDDGNPFELGASRSCDGGWRKSRQILEAVESEQSENFYRGNLEVSLLAKRSIVEGEAAFRLAVGQTCVDVDAVAVTGKQGRRSIREISPLIPRFLATTNCGQSYKCYVIEIYHAAIAQKHIHGKIYLICTESKAKNTFLM